MKPSSPFLLLIKSDNVFSPEEISRSSLFVSSRVAILIFSFLILDFNWDSTSSNGLTPAGIIESRTQRA